MMMKVIQKINQIIAAVLISKFHNKKMIII